MGYSYFKVGEGLLQLPEGALSKSEILTYLLHCRRTNESSKSGSGVSKAGLKSFYQIYKIKSEKAYNKAMESLTNKGILRYRPEVSTGYFKAPAVEVLPFPRYEGGEWIPDKAGNIIQIPSEIIDGGYLIQAKIERIRAILILYSHYRPVERLGVDFEQIRAISRDKGYKKDLIYGDGYNMAIHKKQRVEVLEPEEVATDTGIKPEALNELLREGLFYWVPVVIEEDPEDTDIKELKFEVFKGVDRAGRYLLPQPNDHQNIIWILRPKYSPETPEYKKFIEERREIQQKVTELYKHDPATDTEAKRESLHSEMVRNNIETVCMGQYRNDIDIDKVYTEYKRIEPISWEAIEQTREEVEGLKEAIEIEKQAIKDRNEEESGRTGKRVRKTTSPKLKVLKEQLADNQEFLESMGSIEDRLLELLPYWIFTKDLSGKEPKDPPSLDWDKL